MTKVEFVRASILCRCFYIPQPSCYGKFGLGVTSYWFTERERRSCRARTRTSSTTPPGYWVLERRNRWFPSGLQRAEPAGTSRACSGRSVEPAFFTLNRFECRQRARERKKKKQSLSQGIVVTTGISCLRDTWYELWASIYNSLAFVRWLEKLKIWKQSWHCGWSLCSVSSRESVLDIMSSLIVSTRKKMYFKICF